MSSGGGFGQWVGMEVIRCSIMLEHAKTAQAYICSTDYLVGGDEWLSMGPGLLKAIASHGITSPPESHFRSRTIRNEECRIEQGVSPDSGAN